MSPITIQDLDQVEAWDTGGLPFPVGKHHAVIEAVEEKAASTGSPQVIISWRGIGGNAQDCTTREWLVILPQTYGKVKSFLQAVKWPLKSGAFSMPTTELVGRHALIVVGTEQRDGKTFTRVMGHLPYDESDVPIDTAGLPGDGQKLPF